jgi:DNA-binding transcriptional MerR regulator
MSNGAHERPYLSIGEVLGLLLEEFPDVTISKIRFLESQGLIEPERTSSGYRKFYDADVERLRVILREQRENFLPLRVIRDRLETGAIDDSGGTQRPASAPRGIRNIRVDTTEAAVEGPIDGDDTGVAAPDDGDDLDDPTGSMSVPAGVVTTSHHPAAQLRAAAPPATPSAPAISSYPSSMYVRAEICALGGVTVAQLAELESYGLVAGRGSGPETTYTEHDLAIVRAAAGFLARGIDARHLKTWRQAAEREAGLFEQRILPLLRQRNPQARQEALALLHEFADLGGQLRSAMVAAALRQHLDS